ncbi:hypothetical protein CKM354_000472100 [Cercospora kikuchii]|uniref:Uncharacterized protein n=1 Tax=Cercospora kikuchii TaxID=84275 RepID=A0A9P3FEW1_9PEZI|nr:uncharacterized protein CKM354_000472100 [Cercospora kikuchii]GIZ41417.1 hypothetical protein CKM354_000472100 [Cercospora kikuchii]
MADIQPLYPPLDLETGEIRLLKIKLLESSDNGAKQSALQAEMHNVSIDEIERKYVALSHTWGDSPPSKTMLLNGQEIKIRESLHDFLIRYR